MILPNGTRCHVAGKVSVDSMKAHGHYQRKGFPLKCPCTYSKNDVLIVKTKLSDELAMVFPELHPKILSIICWKDLEKWV